ETEATPATHVAPTVVAPATTEAEAAARVERRAGDHRAAPGFNRRTEHGLRAEVGERGEAVGGAARCVGREIAWAHRLLLRLRRHRVIAAPITTIATRARRSRSRV